MAIQNNKQSQGQTDNLATNILKTAIDVNTHLNQAEHENKGNVTQEILKAYVKCNRLMAYLIRAFHHGEITRDEYLNFEIQLKDLMNRLEIACEKLV